MKTAETKSLKKILEEFCGCRGIGGENGYCLLRDIIHEHTLRDFCEGRFVPSQNRQAHIEIIEDIASGCDRECKLKELALELGVSDRTYEQLACIKRFKYERGIYSEDDGGWQKAFQLWIKEGHARRFSEVYKSGMKNGNLYSLVLQHKIATAEN